MIEKMKYLTNQYFINRSKHKFVDNELTLCIEELKHINKYESKQFLLNINELTNDCKIHQKHLNKIKLFFISNLENNQILNDQIESMLKLDIDVYDDCKLFYTAYIDFLYKLYSAVRIKPFLTGLYIQEYFVLVVSMLFVYNIVGLIGFSISTSLILSLLFSLLSMIVLDLFTGKTLKSIMIPFK